MNELSVIVFLRSFDDQREALKALEDVYGIKAKTHPRYPELVQLQYSHIDSPKTEPIVRDCRGLILNSNRNWEVVALPFRRFFNYGEAGAEYEIDWASAKVQEKADGSLMILYHYKDEWHVATRGNPSGASKVSKTNMSFAGLFWRCCNVNTAKLDPNKTYLFELCTPYNQIVVRYEKPQVKFLTAFDTRTYREHRVDMHNPVKEYNINDPNQIKEMARSLDATEGEGYVVVDGQGNRLKVKSPKYAAVFGLLDQASQRRILELIRLEEEDDDFIELMVYFPELERAYNEISFRFERLVEELKELYNWADRNSNSMKEMALALEGYELKSFLLHIKIGKTPSIRVGLARMEIQKLERILGLDKEDLVVKYQEEEYEKSST